MYISGTDFVAGQVHLDARWSGMIRGFPKLDVLDLDHSAHAMSSVMSLGHGLGSSVIGLWYE